jgi:adenosylmethionine-8-amino-7-oxononanoate aminotransferase
MHGPTFMANPLACAAANASLDLFAAEPRLEQARAIGAALGQGLAACRDLPGVKDVRVLGAIGVVELDPARDTEALQRALLALGVWVRPFRNILYLTPALTMPVDEVTTLTDAIRTVLAPK